MTDNSIFEKMLNLGDDNALLCFTLGSAFLRKEKYSEAIEQLEKAVEYEPKYVAAWEGLGHALIAEKRIDESLNAYNMALSIAKEKDDKTLIQEIQQSIDQIKTVAKRL